MPRTIGECPSEDVLVAFADGLLAPARKDELAEHLDRCDACRAVVAGAAAAPETRADPLRAPAPEPTPAELVRAYLAKDAPDRERTASTLVAGLLVVGALFRIALRPQALPLVFGAVFLAYEATVLLRMRRGWFHPIVPWVSTCVEVSIGFAMSFAMSGAPSVAAVVAPALIVRGGLVVFSSIRALPRLCLLAGAVSAIEEMILALAVWDDPRGSGLRALFFLVCGVGGALVARSFVRRAVDALREVRERDMFGRYLLREPLGRGGMGEVHRATYCPEGGFVRTVAVKKIRADLAGEPRFVEAFRREAYTAATLAHPNLVQVLDFGRFRGDLMFVMEFVDGVSLDALLRARGGPLPPSACAFVAHEIASALAYLHERSLVHCDVNPPNVLVSRAGEVKLADFGVMRACEPGPARFGGKVAYAAPEQLSGGALDARSDLFALGLTLREALTGRRDAPLGDDVPAPLRALADALVARDPARRPTSAEVSEQLHALAPAGKRALLEALRAV